MPPAGLLPSEPPAPASAESFLKQVKSCRARLATGIAAAEPRICAERLSTLAARTIEGLVFVRMCTERHLETPGRLRDLCAARQPGHSLARLLRHLDARYCQGRRHFAPPTDTAGLAALDRTVVQEVVDNLGGDTLPSDLFGRVYEQSVATLIRPRGAGRVVLDSARATRRARGAYYTPTRLIDHVLDRALARPAARRVRQPRLLDPACGGGAFLLAAYEHLLTRNSRRRPRLPDRRRILSESIFGADSDPRAAETTRLSLLLKLYEGHTVPAATAALPDLAGNIKCGDALVGPDCDLPSQDRAGPIDWPADFPTVFGRRRPGFDAVIGNPPWGQKKIKKDARTVAYLLARFPSARGIFDIFRPFVEQAVRLCRDGGTVGLVLPDIVLLKNYQATRRFLLENLTLTALDWWGLRFDGAVIDAATIVGAKRPAPPRQRVQVGIHDRETERAHSLPQSQFWRNDRHVFNLHLTADKRRILDRLRSFPALGEFFEAHEGVHSGNLRAKLFVAALLDESCRPLLFGRNEIAPYHLRWHGRYLRLSAAPEGRTRQRYAHIGRPEWFARDKLLVRRTGDRILAAVDRERRYASNNFFLVFPRRPGLLTLDGLCALLNSGFMTWYFRTIEPRQGRVFAELKIKHLVTFPLPDPRRAAKTCQTLNELGRRRAALASQFADAASPGAAQAACAELDRRIATVVRAVFGVDERYQ